MRANLYPSGVGLRPEKGHVPKRKGDETPVRGVRGKIEGFTKASARRLRLAFLSWDRPGWERVGFSLTTHQVHLPDQWRDIMERFRKWVALQEWSLIWRVELQRRKTPHLHGCLWIQTEQDQETFRAGWLEATGESSDPEAQKFAVRYSVLRPEWLSYCAAHSSKSKRAQLGWQGRQWGIWGKRYLEEVRPTEVRLSNLDTVWLVRVLKRWRSRVREVESGVFRRRPLKVGITGFTRVMDGSVARRFVEAALILGAEPKGVPF